MIEAIPIHEEGIYGFRVTGRLSLTDYQEFLPVLDELIGEKGRISLLLELRDFKGWDQTAVRENYRFSIANKDNIDRIAVIGEKAWQRWMTALSDPFVTNEIRFFDQSERDQAWEWLQATPEEQAQVQPPQPYRHLLIATDFSQSAEFATLRGIELAKQYGADISLLHVIEDTAIMVDYQDYMPVNIELERILHENAEKQMAELVTGMDPVPVRHEIGFGTPSLEIAEFAKDNGIDLIVVATRGRRGLSRMLGSTVKSLMNRAHCDVLMVRYTPA